MKNIRIFLSENFQFLEVKFSIYLNRRVFVMIIINFPMGQTAMKPRIDVDHMKVYDWRLFRRLHDVAPTLCFSWILAKNVIFAMYVETLPFVLQSAVKALSQIVTDCCQFSVIISIVVFLFFFFFRKEKTRHFMWIDSHEMSSFIFSEKQEIRKNQNVVCCSCE